MKIIEMFCSHFITEHPNVSDAITILLIGTFFIGLPFLVYVLLKVRFNKGRYLFQVKDNGPTYGEHLYLLDTINGSIHFVDGNAYYQKLQPVDRQKDAQSLKKR